MRPIADDRDGNNWNRERDRRRAMPGLVDRHAFDLYLMAFDAMVALARRTREGGSWLVRISLAQVGKWIVDLGEVPPAALKGIPAEFIASELEGWSTVSETPSGRLRHLKPAVQLSENPAVLGAALSSAWLSPPRVAVSYRIICSHRQRTTIAPFAVSNHVQVESRLVCRRAGGLGSNCGNRPKMFN
jgi:hypothetical protein